MGTNTYWCEAIDCMIINGSADDLSTESIAVLNQLSSRANPLSGIATISLPMLSDLNAFSVDRTESYIKELIDKKVIIRHAMHNYSEYVLHPRLYKLAGVIEVA